MKPNFDRIQNHLTRCLTGLLTGLKSRWKSLLYRAGRLLLISYITVAVYAYGIGDRNILPAPPSSYDTLPGLLQLPTPNGETIAALYLPQNLPNPSARYTLLMSHGNGEDLGDIRSQMDEFMAMGLSVFAYDYRGYGKSQGSASASHVYEDIDTAYRYLTETLKISPDRILLYGRSVGGGPSTYLASRKPIAGMILQSTFISTFRVIIPIQILPYETFPNQVHLQNTRVPILLIHGTDDRVIPYWHSQTLYATAPGPKQFFTVEGADHNDVSSVAGPAYPKAIGEWLRSLSP
jgi:abhydrolase domain-containing protein 17